MWVNLLEFNNGAVVPSIHCHTLDSLKEVMTSYPDNYLKVYLYIFYKTCPDPEKNPFFNLPYEDRDEIILKEIKADFSLDSPVIERAVSICDTLYDTPTKRAYNGMKAMMDKIARFMITKEVTTGRDGSLDAITRTMTKYKDLKENFNGIEKDYMEEIKATVRGGAYTAYDQQ